MVTSKDQAIAPTHAELQELFYQMNGSEGLQKLIAFNKFDAALKQVAEQAQPPAPDCRTCYQLLVEIDTGTSAVRVKCDVATCTNGDKYQEAPKVVLWRTE